jgi:hypothetical protein
MKAIDFDLAVLAGPLKTRYAQKRAAGSLKAEPEADKTKRGKDAPWWRSGLE